MTVMHSFILHSFIHSFIQSFILLFFVPVAILSVIRSFLHYSLVWAQDFCHGFWLCRLCAAMGRVRMALQVVYDWLTNCDPALQGWMPNESAQNEHWCRPFQYAICETLLSMQLQWDIYCQRCANRPPIPESERRGFGIADDDELEALLE